MCQRHSQRTERAAEPETYEGETRRLDGAGLLLATGPGAHCWRGFPWWALWLIWPAIMLLKGLAPLLALSATALLSTWAMLALPLQVVGAAALIAVGVMLLRREHSRD